MARMSSSLTKAARTRTGSGSVSRRMNPTPAPVTGLEEMSSQRAPRSLAPSPSTMSTWDGSSSRSAILSVIWSFRIDHGCDLGGCAEVGVVGAVAWSLRSRVSRVGSLPKSDAFDVGEVSQITLDRLHRNVAIPQDSPRLDPGRGHHHTLNLHCSST